MAQITGGPHRGHAAGDTDIEKQASQLASDVKYKVRKKLSGATHMNPAEVAKAYEAQLMRSKTAGTPSAVIALAKKKLMGASTPIRKEEFTNGVELATESIANALYKVFVEKKEVSIEDQVKELKEAYSKINKKGERLYHIIVTDKKTGNTYTRDATREKIAELRANPNISSVEMSERQLDSDKEKTRGANTARVKAGKGLDPVGKEDSDPDNDGNPNDSNDKYIMKRRAAIGKAIAGRGTQKEEFIHEGDVEDMNTTKKGNQIKPMKPGERNTVVISPNQGKGLVAHHEMEGEMITETGYSKFLNMVNQKTLTSVEEGTKVDRMVGHIATSERKAGKSPQEAQNIAWATVNKRGMLNNKNKRVEEAAEPRGGGSAPNLPAGVVKFVDELPQRIQQTMSGAKTKPAKPTASVKEESECGMDEKPKLKKSEGGVSDPREIPTKLNLVKNKFRAMGLKMDYEPEGKVLDERRREDKGTPRSPRNRAVEMVRGMNKQGMMTRSGKTIAQHESERGVSEKDRPQKPEQTTADRLAAKKQRAAAEVAGRERAEREEQRRRRLA